MERSRTALYRVFWGRCIFPALVGIFSSAHHQASARSLSEPHFIPQQASAYTKLPLGFEANRGQSDAAVKFMARGKGYALFLTRNEAVLALQKSSPTALVPPTEKPSHSTKNAAALVRMQLIGADSKPRITGRRILPGKVNYLIGKDPQRWRPHIPTYAQVAYEAVYPGVDLVYYGNQQQLEYDFVVKLKAGSSILDYAAYLGGSEKDAGAGVAVDHLGGIYVAGYTSSSDFPTRNAYQPQVNIPRQSRGL